MFIIQCRDLSEGSGALWFDLRDSKFADKNDARRFLIRLRVIFVRINDDDDSMYQYRIVIIDSDEYYSQPTDKLEY